MWSSMSKKGPIFDNSTFYQIEVRGRVDVDWLKSFVSSAEISINEAEQTDEITWLSLQTDQTGIIGLVRSLHALGLTILQLRIAPKGG
jgi:hypothetical protein